ncbi:MAG TPA: WbuC family cupin fold metalloprotein [Candidatus Binatia bacterium]|jgi:cupin fold WbuC family metalloprotein|nr:WbuC family cupin fold metalloprotein [Candidatus Binatia bacterium]
MRLIKLSDEVLTAGDPLVQLSRVDIQTLKQQALLNPRRRIRICAHPDTTDRLHEMLIVHTRGAYVRPHKHLNKSESVHVIEGKVDVVFFDDAGAVSDVVRLGDYQSDRKFYYRIGGPRYHTFLITSEFLVFHEVTNGPFRREDTVFAPWGPEESNPAACLAFQERVRAETEGKT